MKGSFGEKRKKYNNLRADFDELNRKVKDMDPASDVKRYNKYVSQMNILHTEIESLIDEINSTSLEMPERERAYWKAVTNYSNDIGDFRLFFEKKLEKLNSRGLTQDEALYAKITEKTISDIEKGLSRDTVPLTRQLMA
jgi:heme oxygenase